MSTRTASNRCIDTDDLVYYIIQYLDLFDFLTLEGLNHRFHRLITIRCYDQYNNNPDYKHLWYKDNHKYASMKQRMCHIVHNKQSYRQGFILYGGNFGSLRTATVWIDDNPHEFTGKLLPSVSNRGILGSVGMCIDSYNQLYVAGGWQELYETVLSTCSIYDLTSYQTQTLLLDQPRCFCSATSTKTGHVVVSGGGDSPYRGASVANTCLIKSQDEDIFLPDVIAPFSVPRCGHSSVTTFNDNIYVVGGYSGGLDYCETMEYYSFESNQWYSAPSMSTKRSGCVCVLGPYGSIYVCGGSSDGSHGNKSLERFDPREGKWYPLASMVLGRGYTSGAVGASGLLYTCGGLDRGGIFQGGMECYDFKVNKWFGLSGSTPLPRDNYDCFPVEGENAVSWSNEYYPRKFTKQLHRDVFSMQLLRSSHQLIYIE